MKPISHAVLETFHANFRGETKDMFPLCTACGGQCEFDLIAPLLPGEAAFLASHLRMPVEDVRHAYLDGVAVDGAVLDVLKCLEQCRFLSDEYVCRIKAFKPIIRSIHPISFELEGEQWIAKLDQACLLSQHPSTRRYFKEQGIQAVHQLYIPHEWFQKTIDLLSYQVNYQAMVNDRDVPYDCYKVYQLDELFAYCY